MFRKFLWVAIFTGLLFGSIFGWKFWQSRQQAAASGGPQPAVVSTRRVERTNWQPALPAVGSLTPTRGVLVSAEVDGIIHSIHFDSGQHVSEGDLLVELDDDVDVAELAALQADRRLAEITRNRLRQIVADNLGSRSDLDEAEANLDSAEARVAAKDATIRKKMIRAPFSGELGIRRINPGQYLGSGDEIVPLVALDPIFVEYSLPERFLSDLALGQEVLTRVQAYPGAVFSGKIHAISPIVQEASRSLRLRALIDNPDGRLRPGMFAEVETLLPEKDDILTLPERSVTFNPYGESVFVVEESGGQSIATLVQISTGEVRDGRVEIRSGLDEGAVVVSDGHNKLRNGQPVTVDNSIDPDAVHKPK